MRDAAIAPRHFLFILATIVYSAHLVNGQWDPIRSGTPTKVMTKFGTVLGWENGGIRRFWGIPYAQQPVGDLRFREPRPWVDTYEGGVFNATRMGNTCIQRVGSSWGNGSLIGEACLNVNIWTPSNAQNLAVLVWIYGGSFDAGSANFGLYDGTSLASDHNNASRVIVVSMNYRVGALGFLALPALKAESPIGTTGNYGLLDQRQAVLWVKENIASFGGDPSRVTIFGESAGGISVCMHMTMPRGFGTFTGAIMESGQCHARTLDQGYDIGQQVIKATGCDKQNDSLACLRAYPPADFFSLNLTEPSLIAGVWGPTVDGIELPMSPDLMIARGTVAPVPLIAGTTGNEGNLFLWFTKEPPLNPLFYGGLIVEMFGASHLVSILAHYPCLSTDCWNQTATLLGDYLFNCPTHRLIDEASKLHPSFIYRFAYAPPCNFFDMPTKYAESYHGAELPYVFGNLMECQTTPSDQKLSYILQSYWTQFSSAGNPNRNDQLSWPEFNLTARDNIVLDKVMGVEGESSQLKSRCKFWDGLVDINYRRMVAEQM